VHWHTGLSNRRYLPKWRLQSSHHTPLMLLLAFRHRVTTGPCVRPAVFHCVQQWLSASLQLFGRTIMYYYELLHALSDQASPAVASLSWCYPARYLMVSPFWLKKPRIATRKLSVCPSDRLSVICVICDKTKERCANILIPHETFVLLLETRRTVGRGNPFYLKFRVNDFVGAKTPIFNRYSLVAP